MLGKDKKSCSQNKNDTQSEMITKLSHSQMLDTLLNSVNLSSMSQTDGGVTVVVANARYKTGPKIKSYRDTNTLSGVAPVTWSSRSY